jgi:hypothetical protein
MATSTELLRAAEHMAQVANDLYDRGIHATPRIINDVVSIMRDEAKRLQAIEARRPKRSWPEGWPPFAVLRRAYRLTDMYHEPSTRTLEHVSRAQASYARKLWSASLRSVLEGS